MKRLRPPRRGIAISAAVLMATTGLAACGGSGGSGSGPAHLTWYINPDVGNADASKGGQATLAKECSQASGGKYRIKVQLLPNSASDQRIQLLRRLAGGDKTMDLMSVDPAFVSEFAAAGYFAPVPKNMIDDFKADRVQSSIDASTYGGKLMSVPFWSNTQLLWYKKSVAKKAGLDMSKPITWDQLIKGAQRAKMQIGVQAKLYEGYSVWINALVAGAGGEVVKNPNATYENIKLGLDTKAGKDAAKIIHDVSSTGVGGPAMGNSTETESLNLFSSKKGGFLVNWPYTYGAYAGKDKADVAATMYPQTVQGEKAAPPYGGIQLAVGKDSQHADLAYQAAACITNQKHQADYMAASGNPASRKGAYETAEVKKAFPNGIAAEIRKSLDVAAARPLTPYWGDISTALQQKFSPPSSVNQQTPAKTQSFILKVLNGKALL
ncbi:sugar ABC transporter substrate-binding protein [Flexivirga endophytica]|uniref:Sugar ABC transporter substrate-binding protein n=2 Tax=Flexivirga endophytica TaxID=1849103 RepID=A0A916THL8_9MICO|nr:sugar ABC transporter substrate-binding protein [Flexivirga endophytica]GHB66157.1 sugar ABC transporter substrate-binding protein [Flexivirga endophytica]